MAAVARGAQVLPSRIGIGMCNAVPHDVQFLHPTYSTA